MFEGNAENQVEKGLQILGINNYNDNDKDILLNELAMYILETQTSKSTEKIFDLNYDYKYYFCDFMKIGINLNTDEISWWEFNSLLEGFFLDEKSTISTVLGYRTYKKPPSNPKTQESNQNRFYNEMKRKYALPHKNDTKNGFEKMWNYVESKVKDKE